MKKIIFSIVLILSSLLINNSIAQCTRTTIVSEGFEGGTIGTGASSDYVLGTCNIGTGKYVIVSNADDCAHPADAWKQTGASPNNTARGGTQAMLVDGFSAVANSKIWCKTVTLTNNVVYDFSAWYTSPWMEEKVYEPSMVLTIGGVQISPAVLVENNSPAIPYYQQSCYYRYTGATGSVEICVEMRELTVSGQGNDILIDDILFESVSGAGCPSSGTCTYPGITLSFDLLSFKVSNNNGDALLKWITSDENNVLKFVVERSLDGISFEEIGQTTAKNSSYSEYSFVDKNLINLSYYRLKAIETDGTMVFSPIEKVQTTNLNVNVLIENSSIKLKTVLEEETTWTISLYSLIGQECYNKELVMFEGENELQIKDACSSNVPRILKIVDQEGRIILSKIVF